MTDKPVESQQERVYTAAVIRRGDKFLCLYHKVAEVWLFPGGKPKPGEALRNCVIRECREELGIYLLDVEYRESHINWAGDREWIGAFFDVASFNGEPELKEPHKHGELRWMTFDEMSKVAASQPEMGIVSFCRNCAAVPSGDSSEASSAEQQAREKPIDDVWKFCEEHQLNGAVHVSEGWRLDELLAAYSAHQSKGEAYWRDKAEIEVADLREQLLEKHKSREAYRERAESAEAALATAQQRIAELERLLKSENAVAANEIKLREIAQQENAKLRALVGLDKYPQFESILEVGQALIDKDAENEKLRTALEDERNAISEMAVKLVKVQDELRRTQARLVVWDEREAALQPPVSPAKEEKE